MMRVLLSLLLYSSPWLSVSDLVNLGEGGGGSTVGKKSQCCACVCETWLDIIESHDEAHEKESSKVGRKRELLCVPANYATAIFFLSMQFKCTYRVGSILGKLNPLANHLTYLSVAVNAAFFAHFAFCA